MVEYIERTALRDALYDADAITMQGVKILNQFPPQMLPRWCGAGVAHIMMSHTVCSAKRELVQAIALRILLTESQTISAPTASAKTADKNRRGMYEQQVCSLRDVRRNG